MQTNPAVRPNRNVKFVWREQSAHDVNVVWITQRVAFEDLLVRMQRKHGLNDDVILALAASFPAQLIEPFLAAEQ